MCLHENATITLYEEKATDYRLEGGAVAETDDDLEPQPLKKVDVVCPSCDLKVTYEDWHQAPDPIRAYCQCIYQREYGLPNEEGTGA